MGIQGLLPFVKNASRQVDINNFSGATVAVDAYCWLHKGAFSCAEKLVKGEKTDGYIYYCMKMVNMLLAAGLKPILVFDGCNLPLKKGTEEKRRQNRDKTRKKGKEFLREGKLKEARECFQRCVDVTSEMAHDVIQACRKRNVDYIVAPYEADAQLTYLNKCGIAQIIISEDSDLILFGCERIIFKMDSGGRGIMVENKELFKCLGSRAEKYTFEKFRYMCILSGCDYLSSLPGIGLAKACKFFSLTTNPDINMVLSKLSTYLKMPNINVSQEYKEAFSKANNTFLYQLVFCPLKKKLVPLNPYPNNLNPRELSYAGPYLPDDIALQLALGNLNVQTMKQVDNFDPTMQCKSKSISWESKENTTTTASIWDDSYKIKQHSYQELSEKEVKKKIRNVHAEKNSKPNNCLKKRPLSLSDTEEDLPSNETLYSIYSSPLSKKVKVENLSPPVTFQSPCKSLQTSCKSSALNQFKINTPSLPQPIIRSRFFCHPNIQNAKQTVRPMASWLDSIDKEYQIDAQNTSPDQELQITIPSCKHKSDNSDVKKGSYNENSLCNKQLNDQSVSKHQDAGGYDTDSNINSVENITKFQWKNRGNLQRLSKYKTDIKLSSSPSCQLAFKQVCTLSTLNESNKVQIFPSQSTDSSADDDKGSSLCSYSSDSSINQNSDSSVLNLSGIGSPDSGIDISMTTVSRDTCSIENIVESLKSENSPEFITNELACSPTVTSDVCNVTQEEEVLDTRNTSEIIDKCTFSSQDGINYNCGFSPSENTTTVASSVSESCPRIKSCTKYLKLRTLKNDQPKKINSAKSLKQTSLMDTLLRFQYKR